MVATVPKNHFRNALITGGAGFIGSHLADTLLHMGVRVVVVDNLDTGRLDNIRHLIGRPDFDFVQASILDEVSLEPLVRDADQIYHLAAAVGVRLVVERPLETLETNTRGTENILRLAHRYGGKKVVLASTSEVYGNSPDVPFREDSSLSIGPSSTVRWGYACSKLYDEFLALAYHQEMGLPVVILRLFNTVGPRQSGRYGMVVPRFVSQALEGSPITVYGDGMQTRCFTHVRDVVQAMVRIVQIPEAEGQVFNLGNDREITIRQLGELVRETLGSNSPIEYMPYSEAYGLDFEDVRHRVPDISKIQGYIDYHPTTDLAGIIQEIALRPHEIDAGGN